MRIELRSTNVWVFEVFWRRLILVMTALLVVLWLMSASALYFWLERAPHNHVGWLDLAAPWRWSGLRAKRGDTAIDTAKDNLAHRDFANAFYNLRAGVSRSPGNVEGRLLLARFLAPQDPVRGVALMEEGLPTSYDDPTFLNGLLAIYSTQQIHARALETVDAVLAGKYGDISPATKFMLVRARATLLIQLQRYADAEQAIVTYTPANQEERSAMQLVQIELLLRAGRTAEAATLSASRNSTDLPGLRQAVEIAVALDDSTALQSALRRLKATANIEPQPYLLAFQSWHRLKRSSFRNAAEDEFYRTFSQSDGALQAMASLAVNLELPEVISRAQNVARQSRFSQFAYRVHQTELALRQGQIEVAVRYLRDWENSIETLSNAQRFYPEFIKRLTRAAFSGTPDQVTYLLNHLATNRAQATLPVFTLAITIFDKIGDLEAADRVAQAGSVVFPYSDSLVATRTQLNQRVAAAAAVAKSPTPASTENQREVVSIRAPDTAAQAREQIRTLLDQDHLAGTRDLLRAIRNQKPAWLAAAESEISAFEIELSLLTLDQLASRSQVRVYLGRYRTEDDVMRLTAIVPRLFERKREADGRLLYEELMASPNATVKVQHALRALNVADDLGALAATQGATLTALDNWIASQEWAQAERLLKYLREKPPTWLAAASIEIKSREVLVRLGTDQRPAALASLRELVLKPGVSRVAAFALVHRLMGEGAHESARVLAREIARLLPDDQAAIKLLKETDVPTPTES